MAAKKAALTNETNPEAPLQTIETQDTAPEIPQDLTVETAEIPAADPTEDETNPEAPLQTIEFIPDLSTMFTLRFKDTDGTLVGLREGIRAGTIEIYPL